MCLVCHKIMTQRKLDTIKRHNVRRHGELQGMSHIERQILFDKLLKQHNETMTNTSDILSNKLSSKSKPKYKSTTDSNTIDSLNGKDSNEIVNDLIQHTNSWLTNPSSEINQVPNPIMKSYSSSINLPFSDHIPYKRNKRLFNKKDKKLYTTTELIENTTNKKNKRLPKRLQKDNSHCSLSNSTENLNDHYNLSVSTNPLERLSFIGWKNYSDALDISNLGDQLKTRSDKKAFVSNVTSSISMIQPLSSVSTISHLSTNCSLPSLSNASFVLPSNYEIEKLKQFIKPFISLNYNLFSQSLLSSSSPPTKLPTSCHTMDNSNTFIMPRLSNELNCTTVGGDILHTNFMNSINKGNQNIRFDIEEHTVMNEYNKIVSDESSERIVDERLNDKNYPLNNNNKNNNTSKEISPVNQSNLLNVNESLKRLRSSSSHSSNDPVSIFIRYHVFLFISTLVN